MKYGQEKNLICTTFVFGVCKVEVRIYNSQIKMLDPKTISGHSVGYCIRSKGSIFYYTSHNTRIVELDMVIYFEDDFSIDDKKKGQVYRRKSIYSLLIFLLKKLLIQLLRNQ